MTSEDVIHDFSVPAFRLKHDVLPDRYETLWFTATRPGTYSLYCTQFCGLDHSKMGGEVVALPPPEFQAWLAQNGGLRHACGAGPSPVHALRLQRLSWRERRRGERCAKARCVRRPFKACTGVRCPCPTAPW